MLLCPFCRNPVTERAVNCSFCDFSLATLEKILGTPPKLNPHVHDFTNTLHAEEYSKIRKLLKTSRRYRPNNSFHLVISNDLDERLPLSVHGFWLLNRGGICAPVDSAGACYDLLVLVNPANQRAALCAGYAIEYLIDLDTLNEVMQSQRSAITEGRYYDAMEGIIKRINHELDFVLKQNEPTFYSLNKGDRIISIDGKNKSQQTPKRPRGSPY